VDRLAVQTNVTIGEPREGGGLAEVVDETMPGPVVAGVVIEMMFEAGGLVAPDGSAGGARRDRPEYVEVKLGRLIHELQSPLGSGAVESAVKLANGGGELESIASGGGQCRRTVLFMLLEVAEPGSGGGFGVAVVEELLAGRVELTSASADGDLVASGRPLCSLSAASAAATRSSAAARARMAARAWVRAMSRS
jgi:hypothetical protein